MLKKDSKIFVAGHRGLVGSAILRNLKKNGCENLVFRTRQELDLLDQKATYSFLLEEKPNYVVIAAAKVGGIKANIELPADFISQNLAMQSNLIWGSHLADVPNLLFLGSSCIYPREADQPIKESALMTGKLEPAHAPYAVAKIAGLYFCNAISTQFGRNYFSVMPPNVMGPGDNYHPEHSHVIGGIMRRFHEHLPNKTVKNWGSGEPKREVIHCDELADACHFLMQQEKIEGYINVGTGQAIRIKDLSETIQRVTGHSGKVEWDTSVPDGIPEKTMDVTRINEMGWSSTMSLEDGLRDSYEWFKKNVV